MGVWTRNYYHLKSLVLFFISFNSGDHDKIGNFEMYFFSMHSLYCWACLQVDKASFGYIFHQRRGGKAYYNSSHKVKQLPM